MVAKDEVILSRRALTSGLMKISKACAVNVKGAPVNFEISIAVNAGSFAK